MRMKERERAVERGVMGFLRKCGGEVRKVVKMDWGGITKYILDAALQRILGLASDGVTRN